MFSRSQILNTIYSVNRKIACLKEGMLTLDDEKLLKDCKNLLLEKQNQFDFRYHNEKLHLIKKINELLGEGDHSPIELQTYPKCPLISLR